MWCVVCVLICGVFVVRCVVCPDAHINTKRQNTFSFLGLKTSVCCVLPGLSVAVVVVLC